MSLKTALLKFGTVLLLVIGIGIVACSSGRSPGSATITTDSTATFSSGDASPIASSSVPSPTAPDVLATTPTPLPIPLSFPMSEIFSGTLPVTCVSYPEVVHLRDAHEKIVVYEETSMDHPPTLHLLDLSTGVKTNLHVPDETDEGCRYKIIPTGPRIYGERVAWRGDCMETSWILVSETSSGKTHRLTPLYDSVSNCDIYEDMVIWFDSDEKRNTRLHIYNLATDKDEIVPIEGYGLSLSMYGEWIVYSRAIDDRTVKYSAYNVQTGEKRQLSPRSRPEWGPRIFGTTVVWLQNYTQHYGVLLTDLETEVEVSLAHTDYGAWLPELSDSLVVWVETVHDRVHVYDLETHTLYLFPQSSFDRVLEAVIHDRTVYWNQPGQFCYVTIP